MSTRNHTICPEKLVEMCQAITTGQCSSDLGLYIWKASSDKHLITLVNYIVKVYSPIIIIIHQNRQVQMKVVISFIWFVIQIRKHSTLKVDQIKIHQTSEFMFRFNLQATKLFIVTSATKGVYLNVKYVIATRSYEFYIYIYIYNRFIL